jgi:hypothetical protein
MPTTRAQAPSRSRKPPLSLEVGEDREDGCADQVQAEVPPGLLGEQAELGQRERGQDGERAEDLDHLKHVKTFILGPRRGEMVLAPTRYVPDLDPKEDGWARAASGRPRKTSSRNG